VAVEPSETMIAQRPAGAARCVQGYAEDLPFADGAFDAAMAVLSDHHWRDWRAGYREMRRVAGRIVIFTYDPDFFESMWIWEYVPFEKDGPSLPQRAAALGAEIRAVPVPWDCRDGFFHAYWRRPHAYLDPVVRANISIFSKVDAAAGIVRLRADLESGEWERRFGHILTSDELDCGYRLLVAPPADTDTTRLRPDASGGVLGHSMWQGHTFGPASLPDATVHPSGGACTHESDHFA
jgi:SAM-dependent methyltransferase